MGRAFSVTFVIWNSSTHLIWTDILPQRIVLRIWPINVKIVKLGLFLLRNWKFIRLKIVLKNTSVVFALLSSSPKLVIRIMLIVIKGPSLVLKLTCSAGISGPSIVSSLCPIIDMIIELVIIMWTIADQLELCELNKILLFRYIWYSLEGQITHLQHKSEWET